MNKNNQKKNFFFIYLDWRLLPSNKPAVRTKYFYTHLTANEVLRFYGSLFGMSGRMLTDRIRTLLTRVEMTRFADVPLGKYSKGMLQRVGLCQTLLHDPEVILLDEPMSGLDPVGRALVRDIILEERSAGRTVFFC